MNHAVGFGIRYRTPIGPVRLDLAYSINPPRFTGFSGSFSDLLSAGPEPCQHAALQLRSAEHQPFPILLLDRTDILMRRAIFHGDDLWRALAGRAAGGEIIDRIAVSVGNRVITEADVDREIRLTALLNNQKPDFSPANKRAAAERMVDQALVRNELEAAHYPPPTAAETNAALAEEKARYRQTSQTYRRALAEYGVTEDELKTRLTWQLMLVRFIDVRFRPGIQISDDEIRKYFDEHMRAGVAAGTSGANTIAGRLPCRHRAEALSQAADEQVEQWLKEARRRTHIQYHDEVFQ